MNHKKRPKTTEEAFAQLHAACGDFLYEFVKAIGIIRLVKRVPGFQLREWVNRREKR